MKGRLMNMDKRIVMVAVIVVALVAATLGAWLWNERQERIARCYEMDYGAAVACLRQTGVISDERWREMQNERDAEQRQIDIEQRQIDAERYAEAEKFNECVAEAERVYDNSPPDDFDAYSDYLDAYEECRRERVRW